MSLPHVTVIGAGQVGATVAHLLFLKRLADVTLIDVVQGLAKGKALDMSQSAPLEGVRVSIEGTNDHAAMADSHLVIVTAGLPRKPGMSRDDLLSANAEIVGPLAERIATLAPKACVIVVTNPLDLMVALVLKRSGFPRQRVMGMAGTLDSGRLRTFVAQRLKVPPHEVQAMVLGSHGDLMVPLRSSITVAGTPLTNLLAEAEVDSLLARTRGGGAEILSLVKQGSAFYAPASGTVEMARAILEDRQTVLPVCAWLQGEYGIRDVCIGVPAQLGATGIGRIVELPLTAEEQTALTASANQVREGLKSLAAMEASSQRWAELRYYKP